MIRKFLKIKSNNKGYFLIEVLIAMSIFTIGISAFFFLLSRSLSLNRAISDRFTANYLAAEGLELAKNIIDKKIICSTPGKCSSTSAWNQNINIDGVCYRLDYNTTDFSDVCVLDNTYLNYDSATGVFSYSGGSKSPFNRLINLYTINDSGNQVGVKVISTVKWSDTNGQQSIQLEDQFFKWR